MGDNFEPPTVDMSDATRKVQITFEVPASMRDRLDAERCRAMTSRSTVLRGIVAAYFAAMDADQPAA
jgi:hypothetical protein